MAKAMTAMTFDEKLAELKVGDRPVFRRFGSRPPTAGDDEARRKLEQMRARHAAVLQRLQEQVKEGQVDDSDHKAKMEQEMDALKQRLAAKQKDEQALGELQSQHSQRMAEIQKDVARCMTEELAKVREAASVDAKGMKEAFEKRIQEFEAVQQQRRRELAEQHEAQAKRLQAEIQDAHRARRRALEEAAAVQVAVAAADERLTAVKAVQEELSKDREQFEASAEALRVQRDERIEKLRDTELEIQRTRTEVELQRAELARAAALRLADDEALAREREDRRRREAQLQEQLRALREQLEAVGRDSERQALTAGKEHQDVAEARRRLARATDAAEAGERRLQEVQQLQGRLQEEVAVSRQRQDKIYERTATAVEVLEDDLEQARQRESELMTMLNDFQRVVTQRPGAFAGGRPRVSEAAAAVRGFA